MRRDRGVGVNLRLEHIDDILTTSPEIPYFEAIAENWFSEGPHQRKLQKLRQDYPLFLHCVGMNTGGLDPLDDDYFRKVLDLIKRFEPELVSDHLCLQRHQGIHLHDLLPFPKHEEALQRVGERVDRIQEYLQRQILLENLSYYTEFMEDSLAESEFLAQLCHNTGCGLLLDLNNVLVNTENLSIDPHTYIKTLPLDQVREVHVAGGEWQDGVLVDTHGSFPSNRTLGLLQHYIAPDIPVIYERDAHIQPWDQTLLDSQTVAKWRGRCDAAY